MNTKTPAILTVLFSALTASHAGAAILLDFGPTVVADESMGVNMTNYLVNSPFHTATTSTDIFWNKIQTADIPLNGLKNSADNSTASGLALNLGAGNATDPTIIALTNQPDTGNNALGTVINTGVYAGSSVGTDGIFEGTGSAIRSVGFQLTGLAAGTYDIYLNTRNTNTSNGYTMTSFAAAGAVGDFDHSSYSSAALTYPTSATGSTAAWVQGGNYTKLTVTLTAGQALNVAVAGSASVQTRGFLNSAAIVAVPEPSGAMLALLGLGSLLTVRRRGE